MSCGIRQTCLLPDTEADVSRSPRAPATSFKQKGRSTFQVDLLAPGRGEEIGSVAVPEQLSGARSCTGEICRPQTHRYDAAPWTRREDSERPRAGRGLLLSSGRTAPWSTGICGEAGPARCDEAAASGNRSDSRNPGGKPPAGVGRAGACNSGRVKVGSAYGIRTRVTAVRGRRPGPLDECAGMVGTRKIQPLKSRGQGQLNHSGD